MIQQKIIVPGHTSMEMLENGVAQGGKFVVFEYCIAVLFVLTLRRLSPAIYIESAEDVKPHIKKYNRISYWLGWMNPFGIRFVIRSTRLNRRGGIEVTQDVMLNLNEEALAKGYVEIERIAQLFERPSESDRKAFEKTLVQDFRTNPMVSEMYVGLFVNTDEYTEPYYIIGFKVKDNFEKRVQDVEQSLHRVFKKYVPFYCVDLNEEEELSGALQEQGEKLF